MAIARNTLVKKAVEASLAAVEVYNKPAFEYREETFSILMLNAWELLLKARIIKEKNTTRAIFEYTHAYTKTGKRSTRRTLKRSPLGIATTIGIDKAINTVQQFTKQGIDENCVQNLRMLREIRDSSVHLYNIDENLSSNIQMVAAAALKNFVLAAESWFKVDFSKYKIHLMPLSFHPRDGATEIVRHGIGQSVANKLTNAIARLEKVNSPSDKSQYCLLLPIHISYKQADNEDAITVRIDDSDPNAAPVEVTDDVIKIMYPLTYRDLLEKLKNRYANFKVNRRFHDHRKELESNQNYCHERFLNIKAKKTKQKYYSPKIIEQFDRYYIRRVSAE